MDNQNLQYIAIGSAGLSILMMFVVIWLYTRVRKLQRLRKEFKLGEGGEKGEGESVVVDEVLVGHNKEIKKLSSQLDELGQYTQGIALANKKNFQKIGFVRFNPFGDTGGSISFVLALLDGEGSGYVLSSLHGREGNRVYAKEVKNGASKSQLTEEEMAAIKQAS